MNTKIEKLVSSRQPFLTDGGFETWLFFVEGFDAPEFAANLLLDDPKAHARTRAYHDRFLAMAAAAGTGYVLDTNTWRGCVSWAEKLAITEDKILRLTRDGVEAAREIAEAWHGRVDPILINGVIGPSGDGYDATDSPDESTAEALHQPQIDVFAESGVDMISALTITNIPEAIGIVRAAARRGLPIVMSFTLETDGRLPSGDSLADAIGKTDAATDGTPLHYMINCAHPDHFQSVIGSGAAWVERLGGIRANASRLSHAELDNAEVLDDGDPVEFGELYRQLSGVVPHLRVVGGCCGTDHRHVGCVSHHLHRKAAA
jgi:homocysteine S-methyltransferase